MRTLTDITQQELEKLYVIFKLDIEELENKPDIHKLTGKRVLWEEGTLLIDNHNNWGFLYKIEGKNGAMSCICKDDGSERNYEFPCEAVIKFLYSSGIDLFNLKTLDQHTALWT